MLELRDVQKSYGSLVVTDHLSLKVETNELRAIIGPNGAGKTSLISQISGELNSDRGDMYLDGACITALSMPKRRQLGISRTYQITSLFKNFSALDNVRLAVQALADSRRPFLGDVREDTSVTQEALELLEFVGLANGAETRVATLAHGEQRQLEIAMALAGAPSVLLLDEPTSGMGSEDTIRVKTLIETLKGRMTIVLIEHDMPTVFAVADRVTVLVSGREIATGGPEEIRGNEQVRASYLGDEDA